MSRASDFFDEGEFEDHLDKAMNNARSDRETEFVDQLFNKWRSYGDATFLSNAQYEWLIAIANRS